MRSVIIGAALALVAGPVFAQSMPTGGSNAQPAPGTILLVPAQGGPAAGGDGGGQAGGSEARGQWNAGGDRRGGEGDRMEHMAWLRAHMGGSSFRFRRGRNEVDVRCAADQPLPVCISAAAALLDKLASMHDQADNAGQAAQGSDGSAGSAGAATPGGNAPGGSAGGSGGAATTPQR